MARQNRDATITCKATVAQGIARLAIAAVPVQIKASGDTGVGPRSKLIREAICKVGSKGIQRKTV